MPRHLVGRLADPRLDLSDLELLQVVSVANDEFRLVCRLDSTRATQIFVAAGERDAICQEAIDHSPLRLSEVPGLIADGLWPIDAALIQVSPPDEHGFVSLGVSVEVSPEAVEAARLVIAQVNSRMPRTLGQTFVHISQIDYLVECEEPLVTFTMPAPDETAQKVARHAARLIGDGSTVHCGLGRLPQAVLLALMDKKDLGIHTGALTEAHVDLVRSGAVTGAAKTLYPRKMIAAACLGGERLFNFVANNPMVELHPVSVTNDPGTIRRNHRMVAVHEVVEVDLSGQACAEAIGGEVFAGLGGMSDFMRGASLCQGGQCIVVLTSTRSDGSSRILPHLSPGAEVSLTRSDVRTVVTEYGAAYLHGLNLRERALALIDLAHPNHRDSLLTAAREQGLISSAQIHVPLFTGIYPEEFERTVKLKDESEVFIRPVKPADERLVQEFFYGMSDREVYYRFLAGIKAFPKKDMQRMVNVDYHRQMTLLALSGEFGKQEMLGIARYVMGDDPRPEVDFAVRGDQQGKGLGRALIAQLVEIAKGRGLPGLCAVVMNENQASLHILYSAGYAVTGTVTQGVTELFLDFSRPVDEPQVDMQYERPNGTLYNKNSSKDNLTNT